MNLRVRRWLIAACFVAPLLLGQSTLTAQPDTQPITIAAVDDRGIAFYQITGSQPPLPIGDPLPQFAVEEFDGTAEWTILNTSSVAVSPNAEYIAFTAQREDEAALFIYDVHDQTLTRHPIFSYWLVPTWSPDSEAILLTVGHGIYRGEIPAPDDYVFELATGELVQITYTPHIERTFSWSADGEYIVYYGWCNPDSCGNPTADLYHINRDGSDRFPITDLSEMHETHRLYDACNLSWSSADQRWYYEVGCGSSLDVPYDYVYSTNLAGEDRLEIDLAAYLLSTDPDGYLRYIHLSSIHPLPENIYISLETRFHMGDIPIFQWRVIDINQSTLFNQPLQKIAPGESDLFLTSSVISPDQRYLVMLHGFSSGVIIDLVNRSDAIILPAEGHVCDVRWLDNATVVYNEGDRYCAIDAYQTHQINITTGVTSILTADLGDKAWMLTP